MNRRVFPALGAENFIGAIRENFIRVHVVRRTGARLINVNDEMLAMLAAQDLVSGRDDRVGELRVETPGFLVRESGSALDPHCRIDERRERLQSADGKVL